MGVVLEKELIQQCKQGNGDAFGPLIRTYKKQLFSYLWRFANNNEIAEDMFQDTLTKAWKGLRRYQEESKFSSWLFAIAHNVAMDYVRKSSIENKYFTYTDNLENIDFSNPLSEMVAIETEERIQKAICELSEKQKQVFVLRQHSGIKFKEIAKIMKEPLSTVLSHMNYAIKKIKNELREENAAK